MCEPHPDGVWKQGNLPEVWFFKGRACDALRIRAGDARRSRAGDARREPYAEPPKAEKGMQGGDMPDDWQCPNTTCINHTKMVFGKRPSCPSCGTARNAKQPGDWQCPNTQCVNNRNTVFASKPSCPKCGAPRPGSFAGPPAFRNAPSRGAPPPALPAFHNMRGPLPPAVHSALAALPPQIQSLLGMRPELSGGSAAGGAPGDWRCPNAQCINNRKMVFAKNAACPKCGAPKPSGRTQGGANPGDWECPNPECLNSRNKVFAKHSACPACGTEKPADGVPRGRSRSPYNR
mmetsp:Transcript_111233/g.346719  ORF Transcript_111233/g.346719 Transcript_111233/m.346719 type:complete len:290 (+) Transcript_111233:90-959(+)